MERGIRDLVATSLWTLAFMLAVDSVLNAAFRMPSDPRVKPSPMAYYLGYGRSLEGKFRDIVRDGDSASTPFARAGWLEPAVPVTSPGRGRHRVVAYGQSFTFQVLAGLTELDSTYAVDRRGGPSSPPSHLYALWKATPRPVKPEIAVFGVLASSLRGMNASTGATWQFEVPPPFTYPRYHLDSSGSLVSGPLPVRSLNDLRAALRDPKRLREWEAQLARDDDWYEPYLWRETWLDESVIVRLVRRAWYQRAFHQRMKKLHDRDGFTPDAEALPVVRSILAAFVSDCRAEGTLPVVLLFEDREYRDHLSRAVGPDLHRLGVIWIASHQWVDPDNPTDALPGRHFTPEANRRIAAELLRRIREARSSSREAERSRSAAGTAPAKAPSAGHRASDGA
jgi:hypothetical protein